MKDMCSTVPNGTPHRVVYYIWPSKIDWYRTRKMASPELSRQMDRKHVYTYSIGANALKTQHSMTAVPNINPYLEASASSTMDGKGK